MSTAVSTDWRTQRDAALLTLERETRHAFRVEAADALCDLGFCVPESVWPEFAPAVARLIIDKNPEIRCAGLALGATVLPPLEAKALLVKQIGDAVPRVRMEAVGRLADLSLPDTRGVFAAAMNDAVLGVRFEAARGMAALKHAAGLEVLIEALDDAHLRFRAAGALAQFGDPSAIPALKKVFDGWFVPPFDRTQLAGALAQLGDADGFAHLFKRAAKKWSVDRAMAVELLGAVRAPGAKQRLLEILNDPKDTCRGVAGRALGLLGDVSVEPDLIRAIETGGFSEDDRLDVAEGLLTLGTPSGRAFLETLRFESADARAELLELLKS